MAFGRPPVNSWTVKKHKPVVTGESRKKLLLRKRSEKASTERKTVAFGKLLENSLKVGIRTLLVHGNVKEPQMEESHIYLHHMIVRKSQEEALLGGASCTETQQCPLPAMLAGVEESRAEHSDKTKDVPHLGLRQRGGGWTIHTRGHIG